MIKNVNIEKDISIKMNFDSFYELNKEYKSPAYILEKISLDSFENNTPVNVTLYPPKTATKVLLRIEDKCGGVVEATRAADRGTRSYMKIKFYDNTIIELNQNKDAGLNSNYEYTFKSYESEFQFTVEKMGIYMDYSEKETLSFFFTFK